MTDDRPTATCPACDGEQGRYAVNITQYVRAATQRAEQAEQRVRELERELKAARATIAADRSGE